MISYSDSEVGIFHPICEDAINQALVNLGLNTTYRAVVVKIVVTKNILKLIVPSEPLTAISTMLRNTLSVDAALLPLTEYPTA